MLVLYCFISNFVKFEKRFLIFQSRTGFCSVILWSNLCALFEDKYPGEKLARNGKHRSLRIGTPRLIEASQCLTVLTLLANAFDAYCSSSLRRVARVAFICHPTLWNEFRVTRLWPQTAELYFAFRAFIVTTLATGCFSFSRLSLLRFSSIGSVSSNNTYKCMAKHTWEIISQYSICLLICWWKLVTQIFNVEY